VRALRWHVHVRASVVHSMHTWCSGSNISRLCNVSRSYAGDRSCIFGTPRGIAGCTTGHRRFAARRGTILRHCQRSSTGEECGHNCESLQGSHVRTPKTQRLSPTRGEVGTYRTESERTPPCAYAHARAREKSLKNFRLVPLRHRYVQRCRALAVIIPIMPTSELVWLVRQ